MTTTEQVSLGEFALRSAVPGTGAWFVLIVPLADVDVVGDVLARQIEGIGLGPVARVTTPETVLSLAETFRRSACVLIVSGMDQLLDEDWRQIDLRRSLFSRELPVILVLSDETSRRLARLAPNLASWIGGSEFVLDGAANVFSPAEIDERLAAHRQSTGLDDTEVLGRAERGELPAEPQFAEWLFLLGRSDLIGR